MGDIKSLIALHVEAKHWEDVSFIQQGKSFDVKVKVKDHFNLNSSYAMIRVIKGQ